MESSRIYWSRVESKIVESSRVESAIHDDERKYSAELDAVFFAGVRSSLSTLPEIVATKQAKPYYNQILFSWVPTSATLL